MKLTLISAAVAAAIAAAATWYVTSDHYEGVVAKNTADQEQALLFKQHEADSRALLTQTQSGIAINQISLDYEGRLKDAATQHDLDLRRVRDGSLRLRDAAATCGSQPAAGSPGSSTSVPTDSGGAELSVSATEFLLGEADRANGTVRKLNSCIAVVKSDREVLDKILNQNNDVGQQ